MDTLKFDLTKQTKKFKIMNATNGGPLHKRYANDQPLSNFESYKSARIPYSRNHDSCLLYQYGGPHSHDITAIFPDFNADANDPSSYDFACTDEDIMTTLEAGTKVFFRLGQSIEHHIKKHGTIPPKDFNKWAVICEHIIRHYNEGWADGFYLDMQYWEIWNEPDLNSDDSENKLTWGGTKAQFFDFYEIAAKHLIKCFPALKIGGPALAYNTEWAEEFLKEMRKRDVRIDFFSWHIYCTEPQNLVEKAEYVRTLLTRYGYDNAESILNEWNYILDFGEQYVNSIRAIHGIKGAAFIMACMTAAQHASVDMLMYYDTRQSQLNGVFDFYTREPLKGYFAFKWYGMFYDAKGEIICEDKVENIYSLCGKFDDGKVLSVITYYTSEDDQPEKKIKLDMGHLGRYEIYLLDGEHDGELIGTTSDLTFSMTPNSCIMIKEI